MPIMGLMGMRKVSRMIPVGEVWFPGTYHRSVGMGDPKKGQSSRVRLYRITRMSWFRGDSIRGGTSAIPRQPILGEESTSPIPSPGSYLYVPSPYSGFPNANIPPPAHLPPLRSL